MRRRPLSVAIATAVAVGMSLLTACGGDAADTSGTPDPTGIAATAFPLTVDNCGRQVTFDAPPRRVMAIGGEAGSLVWAAGGVDRMTTFAPLEGEPLGAAETDLAKLRQLPVPGSGDISLETILGEDPDLVVTFGLNSTTPADLEAAGVKTLVVSGYCDRVGAARTGTPIELMYDDIATYGAVLGTTSTAETAVQRLKARVAAMRDAATGDERHRAAALFVSDADSPLGGYGRLSMVHEQMGLLGLDNVFADADERYFEPSVERLIDGSPEVLIGLYQADVNTPDGVRSILRDRSELASVPALRTGRLLVIDFFYTGHGLLAIDGLEELARQLDRTT